MFAQVVLPLSSYKSFTYSIPARFTSTVWPGSFVSVPFGRRKVIGVVSQLDESTDYQGTIKAIAEVRDEPGALPPDLWSTIDWVSRYYITPLGLVLKTALPLGFSEAMPHKQLHVRITAAGIEARGQLPERAPAQAAVLEYLLRQSSEAPVSSLVSLVSAPAQVCRRLEARGWVSLRKSAVDADPFRQTRIPIADAITLTAEQAGMAESVVQAVREGGYAPFLLRGVTGSGKTEVYLRAAQEVLATGGSVLVLVPEIALTPQVSRRFREAFGQQVAMWHSHLSGREKAWTWRQLLAGRFRVVVGARSALFAPLPNLRMIIVDEEQEGSYKQEDPAPRYHARDVALVRGREAGAVVVLASATPSVETYYNGLREKYHRLNLSERFGGASYPQVRLVDLRVERQRTQNYQLIFSQALIEAVRERLGRSEQVILLQNRRGFAPVSGCNDCGYTAECPHCAVALSFHKARGSLLCHYCGYSATGPEACPECGSPHIYLHGVGTEQVEEELSRIIPEARIARMDSDTTRRRGSHARILEAFGRGDTDVLLGTQMIAKGLDFNRVTLVGVVNGDTGLFQPDFRAGERTFQLVYQVCGRSGRRRELPGEAIIQTNHPDDIAIRAAAHLDAHRFYNQVMAERKELLYPPFSRLVRLLLQGKDQARVWALAHELNARLKPLKKGMTISGPAAAPLERLRGNWRVHLLIKSDRAVDPGGKAVHSLLISRVPQAWLQRSQRGVRLKIDVDPTSLL